MGGGKIFFEYQNDEQRAHIKMMSNVVRDVPKNQNIKMTMDVPKNNF